MRDLSEQAVPCDNLPTSLHVYLCERGVCVDSGISSR